MAYIEEGRQAHLMNRINELEEQARGPDYGRGGPNIAQRLCEGVMSEADKLRRGKLGLKTIIAIPALISIIWGSTKVIHDWGYNSGIRDAQTVDRDSSIDGGVGYGMFKSFTLDQLESSEIRKRAQKINQRDRTVRNTSPQGYQPGKRGR